MKEAVELVILADFGVVFSGTVMPWGFTSELIMFQSIGSQTFLI